MSELLDAKISEVKQRSKLNSRRIDKLDQDISALLELTVTVKEMALRQNYTVESVTEVREKLGEFEKRLDEIEKKPAKRWESLVGTVIAVVVTALITFLMSRIGI